MKARRERERRVSLTARALGLSARGMLAGLRGTGRAGRWFTRAALSVRRRGAAGEAGMIRLLDLHAASCAGDTLITMGLAGTVFFSVPTDQARGQVALYLLITMAPFALLAPVIGPLLDHFRHGRRYALAVTMLGRAFLAWVIADSLQGFWLYPAAFGVLVLSRAYGVARSAAVPRLLPPSLGLSEAGARASLFGTLAGAAVAPLGVAAVWLGAQWPLRVATVIFLFGMVVALRLPPRADSEPPERLPRLVTVFRRRGNGRALSGPLLSALLTGGALLRAGYGFLALFLAFAIRAGTLDDRVAGFDVGQAGAVGLAAGALAIGSFLATAAGTRLRIRRPVLVQAAGMVCVSAVAVAAALWYTLPWVALLCLVTAVASGLGKLALDATIQEHAPEVLRSSAFAHSETLLMVAWVAGGALGLIPVSGRVGLSGLVLVVLAATVRMVTGAWSLRDATLRSAVTAHAPGDGPADDAPRRTAPTVPAQAPVGSGAGEMPPDPFVDTVDVDRDPPGYHLYRPTGAAGAAGAAGTGDPADAGETGPYRKDGDR